MLRNWQAFQDLAKRFAGGDVCLRVAGLAGSARALAVAELLHAHPRPVVIVVASLADAHRFAQDLKFFGAPAFEFPEREPQLWKGGHHREAEAERAMIVRRLTAGEPIAVVVTPAALDTPLPAPGEFREGTLRLATKDSLDRELLLEALEKAGYERADTADEANRAPAEGFTVRIVAADAGQADDLREIVHDHDIDRRVADALESPYSIAIVVGELSRGFAVPAVGLVVLAETEIFGARRRMLRRPKYQRGAALTAFTDLAVNDLVVHEDHGIGQYLGLRTMHIGDKDADFLLLEYADGNELYVPVDRLDLVSKYLGADAGAARLARLGGASWQRVKESVRAALREMAEELLKLYARRSVAQGHTFAAT